MCVADGEWLGIYSMATRPEARRRGLATAVLRELARTGRELGAARGYLQTERTNAASHALYGRVGFAIAYGYHYRTKR
jgi:GNAT superfamily N-acetyltransferase